MHYLQRPYCLAIMLMASVGLGQVDSTPTQRTLPEVVVEAKPQPATNVPTTDNTNGTIRPAPTPDPILLTPSTVNAPSESTSDSNRNSESALDAASASREATNSRQSQSSRSSERSADASSRGSDQIGKTHSASSGTFGQLEIANRPYSRPAEILEQVPGLIATQHSGSGKANQYFVRGFNLDHGTDFALRVNDVPINLPSHAHGQGYLDINWLLPELVDRAEYQLGPYYANLGDFSSAGGLGIDYANTLPHGIASVTAGQFDYYRTLVANSSPIRSGQLLYAFETVFYDGPWTVPENFEKFNGVLRWSQGSRADGQALSLMAYRGEWTATNQISQRALQAGLVDRFGSLDPSDGGDSSRVTLNWQAWNEDRHQATKSNVYVSYYDLNLFSNFTYFLDDPVRGDQIQQMDGRVYSGFNSQRKLKGTYIDHTFGTQFRNDNISDLGLNRTQSRTLVSQVRNDSVDQQNLGLYYQNEARWTDWLRTTAGIRGDAFRFHNRSRLNAADTDTTNAEILSPKLGVVFGPWADTELFGNWGQSFHSNDARGINSGVDPANPLVKSKGEEVGLRSWLTPQWNTSLALWSLELDSELVFVGDAGTTEPGPASDRLGITWSNHWAITRGILLDADIAHVKPRFATGERIPNAVENVIGSGLLFRIPERPWYSALRLRHYGPAALIEDNSARSGTTTLVNAQFGYDARRWQAAVDIYNLFNRKDNDITYFYESQPLGLAAAEDYHFHPVEPVMARATLTWKY